MKPQTAYGAWLTKLNQCIASGDHIVPQASQYGGNLIGGATLELLNQSTVFDLSHCGLFHRDRKLNYRFMAAEWLWMAAGDRNVDFLARVNPHIAQFSDDGKTLFGAYGPRMFDQWKHVEEDLKKDWASRRAVITIYTRPYQKTKDTPCSLSLQFLQRPRGTLNVVFNMRSQDLWLGYPYDVASLGSLSRGLAIRLGLEPGRLFLNVASMHLYLRNLEAAKQVLKYPGQGCGFELVRVPTHSRTEAMAAWNRVECAYNSSTSLEALGHLLHRPSERIRQ